LKDEPLFLFKKKITAEHLSRFLRQKGFKATEIHGDRAQRDREMALRSFKQGINPILVATSVASRGLDIDNVKHVINYDFPTEFDDYIHRIGRTGRAGNQGIATSYFTTDDDKMADELLQCLTENKQEVPEFLYTYSRATKRRGGRNGFGGNRRFGGRQGYNKGSGFNKGYGNNNAKGFANSNGNSNGNSQGFRNGYTNSNNGYANTNNGYTNSNNGYSNGYTNSNGGQTTANSFGRTNSKW